VFELILALSNRQQGEGMQLQQSHPNRTKIPAKVRAALLGRAASAKPALQQTKRTPARPNQTRLKPGLY